MKNKELDLKIKFVKDNIQDVDIQNLADEIVAQRDTFSELIKVIEKPLLNDKEINRVEIIVLKYKSPEMEKECLAKIIENTGHPYKLTVFDNRGNGPNTAKIWNKLIKESTCPYIVFIDSDAFVQTKGWLREMLGAFNDPRCAIVGPFAGDTAVTTIQARKSVNEPPRLVNGHISGYCFMTKRSIYEELGYFDEDFGFYGQESNWIEEIIENGKYWPFVAPRVLVTHGYEGISSQSAIQAEEEGEMNRGTDSEYSQFLFHFKKLKRKDAKEKSINIRK